MTLMYGVAALLAGYFLVGRWNELGVSSGAEFIELRFGRASLTVYTLLNIVCKLVAVGVSIYSVAVVVCAVEPLGGQTVGGLSETSVIVILGVLIVLYTMAGGLWAVLITDAVQFIVLMLAVAFVVPMILGKVGGFRHLRRQLRKALSTYQQRVDMVDYVAWCVLHFFVVGGELAFVQRHICVANAREAKKATWLFAGLYLCSPFLWMLPPDGLPHHESRCRS